MSKVAFCFPGQGALEAGMGRDIAEAVPEAMEVFRIGSEASGLDLVRLCFQADLEELVETEVQQPALVATSLAILAALRERGVEPDVVIGHSVGEFAALASVRALSTADAIGLVRERGLAMAEAARLRPGMMAAILGLEDEAVESLCRKIVGVWPANYNCPGQIVVSGESDAVGPREQLAYGRFDCSEINDFAIGSNGHGRGSCGRPRKPNAAEQRGLAPIEGQAFERNQVVYLFNGRCSWHGMNT